MSAKDEIEAINNFSTKTNGLRTRQYGDACPNCGHAITSHDDIGCSAHTGAAQCECVYTADMAKLLRTREGDHVLPATGGMSVTEEVIRRFREREKLGISRYGHSLETFNGRDTLVDMLEEGYDRLQYFTSLLMERDASVEESARLLTAAYIELRNRRKDPPNVKEITAYTAGVQDAAKIYFLSRKAAQNG